LHKKEATRFAQDATLLFSLFVLTSFELLYIGGTHSFWIFGVSMLKSLFAIYVCHTMAVFFFCVSFSPSLLRSFA
jgi:hypothetical protein